MTKKTGFLALAFFVLRTVIWAAPSETASSPFLDLLEDEPEVMTITAIPTEAPELSLGLPALVEEKTSMLLQPPFIHETLASYSNPLSDIPTQDFQKELSALGNAILIATPSISVLIQRAEFFKKNRVNSVAREQVLYVLSRDPKNKQAQELLKSLNLEQNQLDISKRVVEQEYSRGLKDFEQGQWKQSLVHFIRVINMNPNHEGALAHIESLEGKVAQTPPTNPQ